MTLLFGRSRIETNDGGDDRLEVDAGRTHSYFLQRLRDVLAFAPRR